MICLLKKSLHERFVTIFQRLFISSAKLELATLKNFEGNETSACKHILKVYLDVRSNSPGSLLATNRWSKNLKTLGTRLPTTHLEVFTHKLQVGSLK